MDFLGNVNVFHGRLQSGRAHVGGLELEFPDYPHEEALPATVYVRPHELDLDHAPSGSGSLRVRVDRVNSAGSVAKVFVTSEEFGIGMNVELSSERFGELNVRPATWFTCRRARVPTCSSRSPMHPSM